MLFQSKAVVVDGLLQHRAKGCVMIAWQAREFGKGVRAIS